MKRILSLLILPFLALMMLTAPHALAYDPYQSVCEGEGNSSEVCQVTPENPVSGSNGVLTSVLRILSFAVGAAAVVMLILGGLKYVVSGGDPTAVKSAKDTIMYAIIGIGVFLASQAIVVFVISKL